MGERKLVRDELTNYPGNSNRGKEETREKLEKVVSGEVITKKKTFGEKVAETFFGDDTRSVGDYLLHDILIPAMKSTLSDIVGGGIEMLLFGERSRGGYSNRSSIYRDRNRSYVSYNKVSRSSRERDSRYLSRTDRNRHNFETIVIQDRGEAEDVLTNLVDLIYDYEVASVADYYDLVGIESSYTDQKYGWTNLADAKVERVRDGYILRLPRPRVL
jgi:hypothetical protein